MQRSLLLKARRCAATSSLDVLRVTSCPRDCVPMTSTTLEKSWTKSPSKKKKRSLRQLLECSIQLNEAPVQPVNLQNERRRRAPRGAIATDSTITLYPSAIDRTAQVAKGTQRNTRSSVCFAKATTSCATSRLYRQRNKRLLAPE